MAQFLRNVHISNVKIAEDVIVQLAEAFANRAHALIVGVATAFMFYVFSLLFTFIANFINGIPK